MLSVNRLPFGLDNFERVSEEMFEKLEAEQNDCHSDRLLGVCIRCRLPVSAQTIDPLMQVSLTTPHELNQHLKRLNRY